jgi:succinate-semialdehyde dehydrogenase / glutarate-semialdehyde dehydrogenase
MSPWNFPTLLPARKLAAGCSVVAKPSEEAPGSTFGIAAAAKAAGLPVGALNVVVGDPAAISAHLLGSPVIRKISFTGSVPVGREIMKCAAQDLKKVSLELGGHAPVLVFEDADPEQAAQLCLRTKFRNAGQVCISPCRFFVHASQYEPFSRAFAEGAQKLIVGRGLDPGVDMGPLSNARGLARAERLLADALSCGAELLAGGKRVEGATLHPPPDGDMIGVQAPISEQFLDVSVRKREAQIPADGQEDHLRFKLPPLEKTAN